MDDNAGEKRQTTVMLRGVTSALLKDACKKRACTQSEIIESAIVAFLDTREEDGILHIMHSKLDTVILAMEHLVKILEGMVQESSHVEKKGAGPSVATYDDMYLTLNSVPQEPTKESFQPVMDGVGQKKSGIIGRLLYTQKS